MLTCINLSKPRILVQDRINEAIFNYKMMNTKQQQHIKTIVKVTETTLTITLVLNGTAYASVGDKVIAALNPLLDLVQSLGYPLAVLSMSGGAIIMMFNKRMGVRIIKETGIAYLVLQFVPGLMKILAEVGRALRA
ncbi:bacitracin ABC transporter ATP-binding protein [Clostridium ganghwense]|uniref:Bacitracin ABC transporter ATP-binding protein n=1 Tax=Clostridium ganghwense TaxID=312089 RepID=A0ABT4CTU1_9CLOT|nr:bacitracin ABC transporter ATP-binding protein [Clostridium ganghwense]MCY6372490.1 bacitracin ABC transporter ATP-binding protein [Clostridium ganghwense]